MAILLKPYTKEKWDDLNKATTSELDRIIFEELRDFALKNSPCLRTKVGAMTFVEINDINYALCVHNEPPEGTSSCSEIVGGCYRIHNNIPSGSSATLCRAVHAEMRLIQVLLKLKLEPRWRTMWVTHQPCTFCTGMLTNLGVKEVRYNLDYPDELARELQRNSLTTFTWVQV